MYPNETLVDLNREVEMMNNPDRWPAWPYLPLKKRGTEAGQLPETAYLYDVGVMDNWQTDDSVNVVCRRGNIWNASQDDETIEFETFTDLLNQGWRVD